MKWTDAANAETAGQDYWDGVSGIIVGANPPAAFYNALQHEVLNTIVGAGLTPDSDDLTQLKQSIVALADQEVEAAMTGNAFAASLVADGYQKLPSGLLLQWSSLVLASAATFQVVTLPIAWPTAPLAAVGSCISLGSYGGAAVADGVVKGWANNAGATLSIIMIGY